MSDKKRENQITEGKLIKAFVMFMLPIIASGLLQYSYSFADGVILGNAVAEEALGSVSSVSAILDLFLLLQLGLSGGCSICVSHLVGAKKDSELDKLIGEMLRIIVAISIVMAIIGIALARPILIVLHTPDSLINGAQIYLIIVFAGMPCMALYNLQSGILRGMGDSKKPLSAIALSSGINIALDLVFVVILKLSIAGAAIATITAEAMSAIYLYKKLKAKRRELIIDDNVVCESQFGECLRLGSPQMVESLVTSGGNVLLQSVINMMGPLVVIGVTVAFKVDSIVYIPLLSIGISTSVFIGQNIGAGQRERISECIKTAIGICFVVAAFMCVILKLFGYQFISLFGLSGGSADISYEYIMICLPFYWIFGLQFVLNGYLQGSKHTAIASIAACIGLMARIITVYLGYKSVGAPILAWGEVVAWVGGVLITGIASVRIYKQNQC